MKKMNHWIIRFSVFKRFIQNYITLTCNVTCLLQSGRQQHQQWKWTVIKKGVGNIIYFYSPEFVSTKIFFLFLFELCVLHIFIRFFCLDNVLMFTYCQSRHNILRHLSNIFPSVDRMSHSNSEWNQAPIKLCWKKPTISIMVGKKIIIQWPSGAAHIY